jgi:ribonuclease VapC
VIVVDTSALMSILLDEPDGARCGHVLEAQSHVLICAGTLAEALIVAERRGVGVEMQALIEGLGVEVASLTAIGSKQIAEAYARWGKGAHPAGLNFGDCFAYALAKGLDCPLLFTGGDFARTDLKPA